MADVTSGTLVGSPTQTFSGGFAIVIIAWLLTPASAAILVWKQNEVEHVDAAGATPAAQGDAAAVQDAFPQAGGAPGLPPGTLPAPSYAPQATGGYGAPGGGAYAPPVSGML